LSPDTTVAGMTCSANGTKEIARNVAFSLGSDWYNVPTKAETFSFFDDLTAKKLGTVMHTPPAGAIHPEIHYQSVGGHYIHAVLAICWWLMASGGTGAVLLLSITS